MPASDERRGRRRPRAAWHESYLSATIESLTWVDRPGGPGDLVDLRSGARPSAAELAAGWAGLPRAPGAAQYDEITSAAAAGWQAGSVHAILTSLLPA